MSGTVMTWVTALAIIAVVLLLVHPHSQGPKLISQFARLGVGITKAAQGNAPSGDIY